MRTRGDGRSRATRRWLGACAAALVCAAVPAGATAAPLPVTYDGSSGLSGGGDTSPPGANDWGCRPSAAHPEPVVLVHGLSANMSNNWSTMSPLLKNEGFCVFALTYGRNDPGSPVGGVKRLEESAVELDAFVDRVRAATGADRVDMVGHSEGTVMPRYWTNFLGGAAELDDYVMFTPLWNGTQVLALATVIELTRAYDPAGVAAVEAAFSTGCASCPQFLTGSPDMNRLNAAGRALPGVTYTNIVTRYDELVTPYTSGLLPPAPNVTNITLQDGCEADLAEHLSVAFDPVTAQHMLNALDPEHAQPPPCQAVLPIAGAPGTARGAALRPSSKSKEPGSAPRGASTGTCTPPRSLRFALSRRRGERIVTAEAFAGARRLTVRRGRALTRLTVRGLPGGRYTLRVRTRTSSGTVTTSTRRIDGCTKGKPVTQRRRA